MRPDKNPCLGCDCNDPDMGCTMPSHDKWYACPEHDNSREIAEILYQMCHDMDFGDYSDTEEESLLKLTGDISKAKEFGLDNLISTLECLCLYTVFGGNKNR